MFNEKGQSLIEIIIATSIFVVTVSSIALVVLNCFLSDALSREKTKALFLAQEGIEATFSIRDNNWDDLISGEHGLALSGSNWVFQGSQEDIGNELEAGQRKIIIEDAGNNRKNIVSQVRWVFKDYLWQEASLTTRLTNWDQVYEVDSCSSYCLSLGYSGGICRNNANTCSNNGEVYESGGNQYCQGGPSQDTCCCSN